MIIFAKIAVLSAYRFLYFVYSAYLHVWFNGFIEASLVLTLPVHEKITLMQNINSPEHMIHKETINKSSSACALLKL